MSYQPNQTYYNPYYRESEKHAKIGGVLILVGSLIGVIFSLFLLFFGFMMMISPDSGMLPFLCFLPLICGIFGIIGGVLAIKKIHYRLALLFGIIGIFSLGNVAASILCLIGVILVGMSKEDFKSRKTGPPGHLKTPAPPTPPTYSSKEVSGQEPGSETRFCSKCNAQLRWIDKEKRWYCDICEEYR